MTARMKEQNAWVLRICTYCECPKFEFLRDILDCTQGIECTWSVQAKTLNRVRIDIMFLMGAMCQSSSETKIQRKHLKLSISLPKLLIDQKRDRERAVCNHSYKHKSSFIYESYELYISFWTQSPYWISNITARSTVYVTISCIFTLGVNTNVTA